MEYKNRVDIWREDENSIWIYEVKPVENATYCLREALGQLLEYSFRFKSIKQLNLVVVGPESLTGEAKVFLEYYQDVIKVPIDYLQHIGHIHQTNLAKSKRGRKKSIREY